jgi:hypothetical protein
LRAAVPSRIPQSSTHASQCHRLRPAQRWDVSAGEWRSRSSICHHDERHLICIENIFLSYDPDDEDYVTGTPLAADQLVRDCPQKQAAVAWPLPVDARLDELLAQAGAAGENTTRKELAAAIIASTRVSDARLGKLLRWYRMAKVRDLVPLQEGENVVPFPRHKPGPRRPSASLQQ